MTTCHRCGLDCTSHKAELSRVCDTCLPKAQANAQREWSNLMDARRANGIEAVNNTELREDGYHNEVTPAVETMADQLRYER